MGLCWTFTVFLHSIGQTINRLIETRLIDPLNPNFFLFCSAANISTIGAFSNFCCVCSAGEHCLDPDTHLLDLYNSNHGGEWVIKLKPNASRGL